MNLNFTGLFLFGLLIRIALITLLPASAVNDWYVPFLEQSGNSLDPWGSWMDSGGDVSAFPYGYAMWFCLLPLTLVANALGIDGALGYFSALLLFDLGLFIAIRLWSKCPDRILLVGYWLSPIVLVATYCFGFNDVIPACFLLCSLWALGQHKYTAAGILLATAVSAKLSMAISVPIVGMYFLKNPNAADGAVRAIIGFLGAGLALFVPYGMSTSAVEMVFSNPEVQKVSALTIDLGGSWNLYPIPMIYGLMIYVMWTIRRINYDLFISSVAAAFVAVVLLLPADTGWLVWVLPVLLYCHKNLDGIGQLLLFTLSACFSIELLGARSDMTLVATVEILKALSLPELLQGNVDVLHSVAAIIGAVLLWRLWRDAVLANDFFQFSKKPFVLGIAGDSGVGKSTLALSMQGIFGASSTTLLSGDDYHRWDRRKPMWQVMTHLNPAANFLHQFSADLSSLSRGLEVYNRHYDHDTGQLSRSRKIRSKDFIVAEGLHTLYQRDARQVIDLKIFLGMDEDLRQTLKISRDTHHRGRSEKEVIEAIKKRQPDADRFIKPQADAADLIFRLHPVVSQSSAVAHHVDKLKTEIEIISRLGLDQSKLFRVLVGVFGLHVNVVESKLSVGTHLIIEGDLSQEDVEFGSKLLAPKLNSFFCNKPEWQEGSLGLMQLLTLAQISDLLAARLLR